jgi:hypothetical protein
MMNEEQIDEYIGRINRCIAILSQLNSDTDQILIFQKNSVFNKAAGQFLDLIVMNLRVVKKDGKSEQT